jgi:hypothetical protein
MQGMSVLLDIGKKQWRVIGLDNHLIFQMLAGASYNLIDYAIQTDTKIIWDHIQIILNMVKTKEDEFFSQIAHERIYLS